MPAVAPIEEVNLPWTELIQLLGEGILAMRPSARVPRLASHGSRPAAPSRPAARVPLLPPASTRSRYTVRNSLSPL